ncbi:hypothetical protein LSAT2_001223 [Lamellibrachia satsuma]|nr:hypothetical protein LSAT2_001223 [Lamellibrachia satsuma]
MASLYAAVTTISSKLFTSTLESIWENKGLKIDGEYLNHLRFADDISLCTETPQELEIMLQELCEESNLSGLRMNISKTKIMVEDNTPVYVNNTQIENVESYVYLGQWFSLRDKNQDKEILRRITAGWTAYAKHCDIFKNGSTHSSLEALWEIVLFLLGHILICGQ